MDDFLDRLMVVGVILLAFEVGFIVGRQYMIFLYKLSFAVHYKNNEEKLNESNSSITE